MKRNVDSTLPRAGRLGQGFTLLGLIGVLAIIAILAAVLAPALIKETDKLAADQEAATLQSFGTALQNNILRTRTIPGDLTSNTNWVSVLVGELGVNPSLVCSNTRSRPRVFVIDTTGFSPISLPYTQASAGVSQRPAQPRFMILSSLGAPLPASLASKPAQSAFNELWNTAPKAIPSSWSSTNWNGGRGEDLLIQRINLAPCFVNLILTTNSSTPTWASYNIDAGSIINDCTSGNNAFSAQVPPGAFFLQGSVLNLYSNQVLDSQQVLQRDVSFVYDQNVWRSSITSITLMQTNPPDFSGIVNAFAYSQTPPGSTNPPLKIVQDFIGYMTAYNNWAATDFQNQSLKNLAVSQYTAMMSDVNGLVTAANPNTKH